jgi:hypothetical protein
MYTWQTEFDGSVSGDNDSVPERDSTDTADTGLVVRHIGCGGVDTPHMIEWSGPRRGLLLSTGTSVSGWKPADAPPSLR